MPISAYEEERNQRIASNKELLGKLGLDADVAALAGAAGECSRACPLPCCRCWQPALEAPVRGTGCGHVCFTFGGKAQIRACRRARRTRSRNSTRQRTHRHTQSAKSAKPAPAARRKRPIKAEDDGELLLVRRSTRARAPPELFSGLPADWKEEEYRKEGHADAHASTGRRSAPKPESRAHYRVTTPDAMAGPGASSSLPPPYPEWIPSPGPGVPSPLAMPAIDIDTDGGAAGQGTMASTSSAEWERNCDSSSNLVAQTHLLANLLGARVPGGRTKEGVMFYFSPSARPKFSKYVGVQEWRNAVFLMFNVVCGNAYGNSFIDKGSTMHVTYYLSERTRVDAPIIKRLADKSPPPIWQRPSPKDLQRTCFAVLRRRLRR
jgi:hypothetical protein